MNRKHPKTWTLKSKANKKCAKPPSVPRIATARWKSIRAGVHGRRRRRGTRADSPGTRVGRDLAPMTIFDFVWRTTAGNSTARRDEVHARRVTATRRRKTDPRISVVRSRRRGLYRHFLFGTQWTVENISQRPRRKTRDACARADVRRGIHVCRRVRCRQTLCRQSNWFSAPVSGLCVCDKTLRA